MATVFLRRGGGIVVHWQAILAPAGCKVAKVVWSAKHQKRLPAPTFLETVMQFRANRYPLPETHLTQTASSKKLLTTSSKKDQVDLKSLLVHLAGLNIEQGGGFDVDHPAVVHADDNGDHYCVIMIAVGFSFDGI